ncbi:MAG TPA: hypothetical protein PLY93_01960 [Turneriella sp.]|nr:hypothetical protein [Turneriella sp.]
MIRELRTLWGIHLHLKIGARSEKNPSPRGYVTLPLEKKNIIIYFEGYSGNISDATREPISFAPYTDKDKSRALSQKFFIRFVASLNDMVALEKIQTLVLLMSIGYILDKNQFSGIVDPDVFLFVPPTAVRAGLQQFHRKEQLLNTHFVSGFNFYQQNGAAIFFTHGLNRFGAPDLLIDGGDKTLTTNDYATALKEAHTLFLSHIGNIKRQRKLSPLKRSEAIPEQVRAMIGKEVRRVCI